LDPQRNSLSGITSKGDAQGVGLDARTGQVSSVPTSAVIEGISNHVGRYGAGSAIQFMLEILPIRAPVDKNGFENMVARYEDRLKRGRNGDNLMTPFQCDNCHFVNMQN
jgi:hypothetical protein